MFFCVLSVLYCLFCSVLRLVVTLTSAMGNLNGRNDSIISQSKCLACHKPTTSASSPEHKTTHLFSRSMDSLPILSDDMDDSVSNGNFPHTHEPSSVRPGSISRASNKGLFHKKTTDLPPLQVGISQKN